MPAVPPQSALAEHWFTGRSCSHYPTGPLLSQGTKLSPFASRLSLSPILPCTEMVRNNLGSANCQVLGTWEKWKCTSKPIHFLPLHAYPQNNERTLHSFRWLWVSVAKVLVKAPANLLLPVIRLKPTSSGLWSVISPASYLEMKTRPSVSVIRLLSKKSKLRSGT